MLIERKEILNENGTIGYIEAVFDSSNILKITYFPEAQRLYIAFNRGETYSYGNVTHELYDAFEKAESQGKFFNTNIKNKNEHPYRKEFTLYPSEIIDTKKIIEEHKKEEEDE
jgi:hypothetical protein